MYGVVASEIATDMGCFVKILDCYATVEGYCLVPAGTKACSGRSLLEKRYGES